MLYSSWPCLSRPSTSFFAEQDVDARDIGERSDAVLRTSMPAHDAMRYATARITFPTLSKISAISFSPAISGGVIAMVSPVTRITMSSS